MRWNKSSRTLPPLVGALLRHRRRARGGESSRVGALFRSRLAASRRSSTGMRLPIFYFKVAEAAAGLMEVGGWIRLVFPAAAVSVDGESGSKIEGTRGASPADGRPATASSSAAHFKAFVRWSPLRSLGVRRPDPVTSGGGVRRKLRRA